ncbi:MAG: AAA family ATPase [Spirochaetales bacterium]|nr:AAA family ATPase [Spirochaetales bacterium]
MDENHTLGIEDLTVVVDPEWIEKMRKGVTAPTIIGQPRGLQALRMGTEIHSKGFNIFVSGQSGTGRRTAVKKILAEFKSDGNHLNDIAYAYNFRNPDYPKVLYFSPGKAKRFKKQLHQLIESLKHLVKKRFESDAYKAERNKIISITEQNENHSLSGFEAELRDNNFQIVHYEAGEKEETDIIPIYNGEQIDFDELQALVSSGEINEEEWNATREKYYYFIDKLKNLLKDLRVSRQEMEGRLENFSVEFIKNDIKNEIKRYLGKAENKKISEFQSELEADILDNIFLFSTDKQMADESGNPAFIRYGINIVEDNSRTESVPVIWENHPTVKNLIGSVDMRFEVGGESRTSFMMIKAGSLIRSSGGFLVMHAEDILQEEGSWLQLLKVLETQKVTIQNTETPLNLPGPLLKPEPVEVDLKVIILGNEHLYDVLYNQSHDFSRHFKISAEFDSIMDRNDETVSQYVSFMEKVVRDRKLLPAHSSAMADVVLYGMREAEHRGKLTTQFSRVADLLVEASYWARQMEKKEIDSESVQRALQERKFIFNLPESRLEEMINEGDLLIKIDGSSVGRINGLAIHDRGYYSFGSPCVISARTAPGTEGLINIEREVGLSGEIHDKWVYILESFLRSRYASDFPLSIYAAICFEQSYTEIDGDSASSTEIYALLSAISDIPLDDGIAVTGSVNQWGEIQPVGGINEKIEGFYSVCRNINYTGRQGVIIPVQNRKNLLLSREVCKAVEEGSFKIYAVSHVDIGMEILTGKEAGKRNKKGQYPAGTINALVAARLREYAEQVKSFSN